MGEILTDTEYLTENILMDGYCLSSYTCKCYTILKQFDGLNFDGLDGEHQKRQNFPPSNFSAIRYTLGIITHRLLNKSTSLQRNKPTLKISSYMHLQRMATILLWILWYSITA